MQSEAIHKRCTLQNPSSKSQCINTKCTPTMDKTLSFATQYFNVRYWLYMFIYKYVFCSPERYTIHYHDYVSNSPNKSDEHIEQARSYSLFSSTALYIVDCKHNVKSSVKTWDQNNNSQNTFSNDTPEWVNSKYTVSSFEHGLHLVPHQFPSLHFTGISSTELSIANADA